jgi:hypothetical protein
MPGICKREHQIQQCRVDRLTRSETVVRERLGWSVLHARTLDQIAEAGQRTLFELGAGRAHA